ncbi:hypothetical protein FB645_002722 [Coemansia sp. IMI 203386]|nr:hypothetical protein FB645_002722 [Coemansia sp. IMI 203386]
MSSSNSTTQDGPTMTAATGSRPPAPLALPLAKTDIVHLQDISARIKAVREPVRELVRSTAAGMLADQVAPSAASSERERLYLRVKEQLDVVQATLHEYLISLPGAASHPALSTMPLPKSAEPRAVYAESSSRSRSSTQGSQDSATYRVQRPLSMFALQNSQSTDYASSQYMSATLPALPSGAKLDLESKTKPAGSRPRMPLPDLLAPQKELNASMGARATSKSAAIEAAILSTWQAQSMQTVTAVPANEMYIRLGSRQIAPLEERMPQIPLREFASVTGAPISVVDMANSLMRSSMTDNEASMFTKMLETLPPGIVACAIANSTSQLFQQLTKESVVKYAGSSQPAHTASGPAKSPEKPTAAPVIPALRLLSDHANFLTRLMETTIMYPMRASRRAKRIEWWTAVTCLLRELGDYESLSSLVCVFSSALIGRLRDTWDIVSSPCKAAIRFMLERVLKIHPNYSQYREELYLRIKRMQKKKAKLVTSDGYASSIMAALNNNGGSVGEVDEASLDFDSAIAINSPDLCSSNENYVDSSLYCKENFDLPPPRALVPIVAVLLKDAVSAEASSAASPMANSDRPSPSHWSSVIESCANQELPLALDYFMLRRIFSTELSSLSSLGSSKSSTPRAISAATSFLKRMPRRQSSLSDKNAKELSLTQCRVSSAKHGPPTIIDLMAHFLYIATGSPCYTCSVGSPMDALHVSSSGQLAVLVAMQLIFAEPWIPREHLSRLCDLREPRTPTQSYLSKSPMSSTTNVASPIANTTVAAVSAIAAPRTSSSSNNSANNIEGRSTDRPWLASFKLGDPADSSRNAKPKGNSKHSSIESARKTSTDSESTCVYRPTSPAITSPYNYANAFTTSNDRTRSSRTSSELATSSSAASDSASKRPASSHSIQAALSPRSPGIPNLPPLPSNTNMVGPSPPPLPSAEMPTWLPTSADRKGASKSPAISSKSLPKETSLGSSKMPPPLPAMPMPRFQPPKDVVKSPRQPMSPVQQQQQQQQSAKNSVQNNLPPPLPTAEMPRSDLPIYSPKAETSEKISAEAQMLLNFDTSAKN